jgi:hypothetical protein
VVALCHVKNVGLIFQINPVRDSILVVEQILSVSLCVLLGTRYDNINTYSVSNGTIRKVSNILVLM